MSPLYETEAGPLSIPLDAEHSNSHVGSEFGNVLAAMVDTVPGAIGAVLSDSQGDAIDFVHTAMSALDIQLTGAQIGLTVQHTHRDAAKLGLGAPAMLVEASSGALLASVVGQEYVLTLVLGAHANVGRALLSFDAALDTIAELLP